ncbi:hypothetical protein LTR10_023740 [Elasticomyces elasticus]|uniref:Adhesin domain-containing protein n=1 Tax=Exophiala sideris TaxID=1016849 RepID=A0ABR0IW83_9EURO|nr:hypothetical protein LTR10_023740 [Elasticomyces elasticus]KAK5021550.1 hypothetical protein LTS07_010957 [Exophiala sideris]KAK5024530.1 hypothetical protein LTR13_010786 [Exophiala sideris]KAK5049685.1 hypothetical protein LTR69_010981 [Exophiala sideris]KAK5176666.1 hypothetical protein LTR44_010848 [Eurotiomycetes sp. CCFEE 6388]
MVLRKQYPSRDYETFSEDTEGQTPRTSDKSRSAAAEAQRLGSMGSWADNFAGNTPATNLTPTASTVDGNEVRDVPYPQGVHELDPSDPPPQYTPSDSTAVQTPTTPSSPLTSRYVPPQAVTKDRSQYPIVSPEPAAPSWPPFPKREHREHETFRSISGTYELYDLLDLSTTSGSISIRVDVQEGEKPATLRLSSLAGSVNVRFATGGGFMSKATLSPAAASRTLNIEISTHAGSISGNLLHGNGGSTVLSSQAGSVSVIINTVGVSELDPPSKISVSTWSGSQNVEVRAPLLSTEAVRAIEATHKVTSSGSMSINYPTAWEGMVHVKSLGSGSVGASGRGLVVQKESSRELYGYRGMKEGRTIEIFEEGSGSVNFRC